MDIRTYYLVAHVWTVGAMISNNILTKSFLLAGAIIYGYIGYMKAKKGVSYEGTIQWVAERYPKKIHVFKIIKKN